jgi:hypothetical protein
LKQSESGSWPHTANRPRAFRGAEQPAYKSTKRTPKKRKADGAAGDKIHSKKDKQLTSSPKLVLPKL